MSQESPLSRRMDSLESIEDKKVQFLDEKLYEVSNAVKVATELGMGDVWRFSMMRMWSKILIDDSIFTKEDLGFAINTEQPLDFESAWKENMLSHKRKSRMEAIKALIGIVEEYYRSFRQRTFGRGGGSSI